MHPPPIRPLVVFVVMSVGLAVPSSAANWPQFRGANAGGVAPAAQPPVKIGPKEGVQWNVEMPWSPSSPTVWDDRIFLTTFRDGRLETRCHDRADGRLRWAQGVVAKDVEEFHRSDGSPAASTPATDGKRIVSYFGSYGLICYDLDGREHWRHPLPLALSAGQYGSGTSPIIVGGTVVLSRDQYRESSLLAFDLETGRKIWESPRLDSSGSFGTPVHWRNHGTDEIVLGATGRLRGYDLRTGAERWVVDGITGYVCTTAVVGDDHLYFAAFSNGQQDSPLTPWPEFAKRWDKNGDGAVAFDEIDADRRDYFRGLDKNRDGKYTQEDWDRVKAQAVRTENVMLAIKPGGTGDISESHVAWKYRKGLPYVPSPLLYEGRIYLVRDGGLMSAIDAKTGEPVYAQERLGATGSYYASPVAADGRIYVASTAGKVTVVRAGGEKPEVLHQADFGERILATPVLSGRQLYLRTASRLYAFAETGAPAGQ